MQAGDLFFPYLPDLTIRIKLPVHQEGVAVTQGTPGAEFHEVALSG